MISQRPFPDFAIDLTIIFFLNLLKTNVSGVTAVVPSFGCAHLFSYLRVPGITDDRPIPDHPSQLRFPGMKAESFERILELAGIING